MWRYEKDSNSKAVSFNFSKLKYLVKQDAK